MDDFGSFAKTCEVGNQSGTLKVFDIRHQGDDTSNLRDELVATLTRPVSFKTVPSILLWDDRGQRLFEDILSCPQYYPFRAELALLNKYSEEMAAAVGQTRLVIELGAGYDFFPLYTSKVSFHIYCRKRPRRRSVKHPSPLGYRRRNRSDRQAQSHPSHWLPMT